MEATEEWRESMTVIEVAEGEVIGEDHEMTEVTLGVAREITKDVTRMTLTTRSLLRNALRGVKRAISKSRSCAAWFACVGNVDCRNKTSYVMIEGGFGDDTHGRTYQQ